MGYKCLPPNKVNSSETYLSVHMTLWRANKINDLQKTSYGSIKKKNSSTSLKVPIPYQL